MYKVFEPVIFALPPAPVKSLILLLHLIVSQKWDRNSFPISWENPSRQLSAELLQRGGFPKPRISWYLRWLRALQPPVDCYLFGKIPHRRRSFADLRSIVSGEFSIRGLLVFSLTFWETWSADCFVALLLQSTGSPKHSTIDFAFNHPIFRSTVQSL